jgi:hypothetical protein
VGRKHDNNSYQGVRHLGFQRRNERGDQVAQPFTPADFDYDPLTETCRCPTGQPMWERFKGMFGEQETISFQGYRQHCRDCPLKHQSLRRDNQQDERQVSFTLGERKPLSSFIEKMKQELSMLGILSSKCLIRQSR